LSSFNGKIVLLDLSCAVHFWVLLDLRFSFFTSRAPTLVLVVSPAVKARLWHCDFWFPLVRSRVLHLIVGFMFPWFRSTLRVVLQSSLGSACRSVLFPTRVFIALSSRTHFARRSFCVCGTSSQFHFDSCRPLLDPVWPQFLVGCFAALLVLPAHPGLHEISLLLGCDSLAEHRAHPFSASVPYSRQRSAPYPKCSPVSSPVRAPSCSSLPAHHPPLQ
jgi:hypothetical protein